MYEGVVLDLLDALHLPVHLERLLQLLLGDLLRQVADVQHLHLGHGLLVGLLLRISPVHDDVASPHLDPAGAETALRQGRRLVRFVFQEAEAAVLLLVVGRAVYDDLDESGYTWGGEKQPFSDLTLAGIGAISGASTKVHCANQRVREKSWREALFFRNVSNH